MSYICLMVNPAGAVAAADTRESFYRFAHFDWLRKVYSVPDRNLIFCCCGPSFRHGVPIFKAAAAILRSSRSPLEDQLDRIGHLVQALTRVRLPREDPGVFVLLAARWEADRFTVYHFWVDRSGSHLKKTPVDPNGTLSWHAGAWHREMPPLASGSFRDLTLDQLRETARARVALAIEKDRARKAANPKHNQTIGGQIHTCALRVRRLP